MKTSGHEVSQSSHEGNVVPPAEAQSQPPVLNPKQPPQNRWVMWMGGAIALAILGLGAMRLISAQVTEPEPDPAALEETLPERVEVVALGRIEPRGEVLRIGGPSGERIAELRVAEGELVQAGDVLAVLESHGERQAQRDLALSQLQEAERRLAAETQYEQSQIREAEARLSRVADPADYQIESQQGRIREIEAQLALAQQDLRRDEALYAEGAISQQQLDRQRTTVQEYNEQLRSARAELARLERSLAAEIRNAQAEVETQQASLSLSQVQAAVDSARENLNLAEAQLERTLIRAPRDGRVLRIITQVGEALDQSGLLDLGDTREMYVVAEVYETDIALVEPGQPAIITSRNGAFEDTLRGTVEELGWQIFKNDVLDDDPAANADARVVEVKIRLDNGAAVEGLTNLQVDVRIDVES